MAQIISLKRSNSKTAHKQSTIAAEYNMDEQFFRLWTYKQTDSSRTEGAKQIITLDKTMARQLRDELNVFLGE